MLYGRDDLFSLVENLVGLALGEDRRLPRRTGLLIVAIMGAPGTGKTAALNEIADSYGNRTPRVLLDLAHDRYSVPPAEVVASGLSPVDPPLLRILRDLQWDLALRVRTGPGLRFPRLSVALLAIATWQPDRKITLEQARQTLEQARRQLSDARSESERSRRQELFKDWGSEVLKELPSEIAGQLLMFPVNVLLKAAVKVLAAKTMSSAERRNSVSWYANHNPRAPGDGYEVLLSMARDFHWDEEHRERAEQLLVAAFLADVSAGCRGWAGGRMAGRPIVLLDNVHSNNEAGIGFLNLVRGSRARAGADPLVLIAAGSDRLRARLDARDSAVGRQEPIADRPPVFVDLSGLDYQNVLDMLDGADQRRSPASLARLIYRLTGGLPLGVTELTRAVIVKIPANDPVVGVPIAATTILNLPVPSKNGTSAESAGAYILRRLIADDSLRNDLITFAPATCLKEAQHLAVFDGQAETANDFLTANGWSACLHHFVGDLFLRTLLLDQLAQRTSTPTYTQVNAALRDRDGAGGVWSPAESERARLYHCLALGDAEHVVNMLYEAFAGPADVWLDALRQAACAPDYAHPGDHAKRPPDRRAVALGTTDGAVHDEIHRSINRLLHAAWFLMDPLALPESRVVDQLASELEFLAKMHPAGNDVLSEAGHTWPAELRAWRQQTCDPSIRKE